MQKKENHKVVVVGGGLAGLTAAYRLHHAGVDVAVYEARSRVGGRVLTIQVGGVHAELGAQNIDDGGEASHLYRLIEECHLEVERNRFNLNHAYFDGKDFTHLAYKDFDPKWLKNKLVTLAATCSNMEEIVSALIDRDDPLYRLIRVRLAGYEGAPLERLSPLYTETLYHMLLGGLCNAHPAGKEENYLDLVTIKGGNSLLPQKLREELGSRIHFNEVLTHLSKENEHFLLSFQDGKKIIASIVILAIPCTVYQHIFFDEKVLPQDQVQAIQKINYGANAKILVPLTHMHLKRNAFIDDHRICFSHKGLLTVYCTEETSRFSKETLSSAYEEVWPLIEKGVGDETLLFQTPLYAEDKAFVEYETSVGYSWPNDPFAGGSYSYISPGQEGLLTSRTEVRGELFKTLFAPRDNLYFAGEHTSLLTEVPGTMEAACESGERIARAIIRL